MAINSEQRVMRGTAGSVILLCPTCGRDHFRGGHLWPETSWGGDNSVPVLGPRSHREYCVRDGTELVFAQPEHYEPGGLAYVSDDPR